MSTEPGSINNDDQLGELEIDLEELEDDFSASERLNISSQEKNRVPPHPESANDLNKDLEINVQHVEQFITQTLQRGKKLLCSSDKDHKSNLCSSEENERRLLFHEKERVKEHEKLLDEARKTQFEMQSHIERLQSHMQNTEKEVTWPLVKLSVIECTGRTTHCRNS